MPHVEKGNTIIAIVIVIVFSAVHMLSALNTVDYYPPGVRRGKYSGLGVFLLQYFPLVNI